MEAVAGLTGYRLDLATVHCEVGFDHAARSLRNSGALSERSYVETCQSLDVAARGSLTLSELFQVYRTAVAELVELLERPAAASQERSLARALSHIREHFAEPLRRDRVARLAGLSSSHFGRVFRDRQGVPFEDYVRRLRVERAKELLVNTDLGVGHVARVCGYPLRNHFHRAFKAMTGVTPRVFREQEKPNRRRSAT
jgi:AraC-like DNA-binding protein